METRAAVFIPLIFAGLSWVITHMVDRVLDQPVLIYEENQSVPHKNMMLSCQVVMDKNASAQRFTYHIENLTSNTLFKDVSLIINAQQGVIYGSHISAIAPAMVSEKENTCNKNSAVFHNITAQPGDRFIIEILGSKETELEVRLGENSDPIRLSSQSLNTFLVKNEGWVLLSVGLFLIIILSVLIMRNAPIKPNV